MLRTFSGLNIKICYNMFPARKILQVPIKNIHGGHFPFLIDASKNITRHQYLDKYAKSIWKYKLYLVKYTFGGCFHLTCSLSTHFPSQLYNISF